LPRRGDRHVFPGDRRRNEQDHGPAGRGREPARAGTTIAAEHVAKSAPDGYTLLFTDLSTHTIMPSIYAKLAFHPLRDLTAVAPVSTSPLIMVAHPSVGIKSAKDLIALAKRHPGVTCGNAGMGTVTHMASEKFRWRAGISLTPVNYKGGATSTISLLTARSR
jgi:tripartite-type tricarboxylate transporter receptor subunit TctC